MSQKTDVWMPIYIGDYLADTSHLTTEEHGAYLLLMFHYWRRGPLPNVPRSLSAIAKLPADRWAEVWTMLSSFFQVGEDGLLHHKRIDIEMERAAARTRRGTDGAANRWGEPGDGNKAKRSERLAAARQKGTHSIDEWKCLLNACGNACLKCDKVAELVKDHIVPIYKGGSDGIDNIQPLCRACNASKGPDETDYRPSGWKNACQTPAKMPAQRLLNDWSSQSQSQKDKKPSGKPEADPRHKQFHEQIDRYWKHKTGEEKAPWDGSEGKALSALLAAKPDLTLEQFRIALKHRGDSPDEVQTERPRQWLPNILRFAGGPLDRYGKPLQSAKPTTSLPRSVTLEEAMQR
jgi:uncharacterized protein YdaU (DUF1376 family)